MVDENSEDQGNDFQTQLRDIKSRIALISQDTEIKAELHPSTWAYDPVRKVILIAEDDLNIHGIDHCIGIIYHEVAHFYITRYLQLMEGIVFPNRKALANLLNAIEDTRIENWIQKRYPGAKIMLKKSAQIHQFEAGSLLKFGLFEQFLLGSVLEWHNEWSPISDKYQVDSTVGKALNDTREMRIKFHEIVPNDDLELSYSKQDTRGKHQEIVIPRLARNVARSPSLKEMNIRIWQMEALHIAEEHIIPVAQKLLENDMQAINQAIEKGDVSKQEIQEHSEKSRERRSKQFAERLREAMDNNRSPPAQKNKFDEECEMAIDILLGNPPPNLSGIDSPLIKEGQTDNPQLAPEQGVSKQVESRDESETQAVKSIDQPQYKKQVVNENYENLRSRVEDQIDILSKSLEEYLIPRKRMQTKSGYSTGQGVDMRRAMMFDANPELYREIWQRRSVPDRRDSAFLLMVDLSGSMMDEGKIENATLGLILLAETLSELEIDFAIYGFHIELIEVSKFREGLTDAVKQSIVDLKDEVDENLVNYDAPHLIECSEKLTQVNNDSRYLIVISDGTPILEGGDNSDDGSEELINAISLIEGLDGEGIQVIGLGLGPGTEHVGKFYKHSVANILVDEFSDEISNLLEQILIHSVLA
uniref:Nicotinate-mononucleotide:5, 6-dimethylbenzimidazole phosphoribosyltransferase CobT n=1 Tax=uncultured marine group II/III euryarchaeote KM3_27_D07 TaxID=1456429 RepID=A0A075GZ03_9EURY|nr:nicotinate-mononucleotide:5,6-dimethylbenzimidazole phosphoribosyltransferase CobT [uncultured marine group II/III euryarchaeote KM3_27_D07]